MGYENDPYVDEDGEPLMDFDDDVQSDPEPQQGGDDRNLVDDEDEDDWRREERSPTPVYNQSESKSKPRKRLIKKSSAADEEGAPDLGFDDDDDDVAAAAAAFESENDEEPVSSGGGGMRKKSSKDGGGGKREKKGKSERREREGGGGGSEKSKFKLKKSSSGYSGGGGGGKSSSKRDRNGDDSEVKEMWDTIAGGDSEDDHEGVRNLDDDNFIDDTGIDPADRYGDDYGPRSPSDAPQAEEGEDDEVNELFKMGKKKKKGEKSAAEIAMLVERVMAELEVVAEEDARLNMESKPAINKLKKLPLLTEVLSKKQLQPEFLDHGVLTLLKNWLEPLPDGSLPNINIRAAILKILTDFPIDLEHFERREQLKKSGLGKVIMFLSKSDEETTANKKLAKDLVDKWSRPIFNKSTRYEDMRNFDDDRVPFRRPPAKRPANKASGMESRDDDLDLAEFSQERKSGQSSSRQHASRPEAMPLDFLVRPQSKIDPDEIRARAKQVIHDQRRLKMDKKLQQLKAPKKKQLQATKLSVEGRGMVKYL
ncbi:hypothetical protein RHGRI_031112 [Rhododendron griersonianum]|uniref:TFIIS N-terminal domain-containing protein n=1 Tax=Rhododendron griersonianum TaxID=479676 RepID=A0AAV6I724_9ERIC|nr:hypothetical protein RHGRI_031112 [Rhododendron griersonianum]KAG5524330.1 hypothetical protein RHGRI_031112 [Rhododendron griersonianum]